MKLKKYNIIPLLLVVYLGVMIFLGYPDFKAARTSSWLYIGGSIFTLLVIVLLRFNLKKRDKLREEREREQKNNERK